MAHILALLSDPAAWLALATLVVMEVVLGIDNLVFVAVLSNKLPEEHRRRGRAIGLGLALLLRLMLLGTLAFIVGLTHPVLRVMGHAFSWRDLILLAGGLFLVWKATREIHDSVEPQDGGAEHPERPAIGFASAVLQILVHLRFFLHLSFSRSPRQRPCSSASTRSLRAIRRSAVCCALASLLYERRPMSARATMPG